MNRILIATDGSASAQEAVDFGLELAREQHAAVTSRPRSRPWTSSRPAGSA